MTIPDCVEFTVVGGKPISSEYPGTYKVCFTCAVLLIQQGRIVEASLEADNWNLCFNDGCSKKKVR